MLGLIIKKEILKRLYDLRFFLLLSVSLGLVVVSTWASIDELATRRESYRYLRYHARERTNLDHAFAAKPPNLFMFIRDGEQNLPNLVKLEPHILYYVQNTDTSGQSLLRDAPSFDWVFLIIYVYSFLAILITYDTVAGEKESGTLRQVLSNTCSRSIVILGSFVGNIIVIWIPLVISCLLGVLLILLDDCVQLDLEGWIKIGLAILLSAQFILVIGGIGLLTSAFFERASTALVASLLVWVCLVVVIPGAARLLVESWYPIPSLKELQSQIEAAKRVKFSATGLSGQEIWDIVTMPGLTETQKQKRLAALQAETYARHERAIEAFAITTGKILAAYSAKLMHQTEMVRLLSRLSPAATYQYAMESILPAGIVRHRLFLSSAEQFLHAYTDIVRSLRQRFRDRADIRGGWTQITYHGVTYRLHGIESISYANVRFDRDLLPEFRMLTPNLSQGIQRALLDVCVLGLFGALAFVLALVLFLRYDIR